MRILEELTVRNFKSIRDQTLRLGRMNVFIGGNGSGKSNLVGVFHFLNQVVRQQLQTYTGVAGGADNFLFFGRKRSPALAVSVTFVEGTSRNGYSFELSPTEEDRFVFQAEYIYYHDRSRHDRPYNFGFVAGHAESKLPTSKEEDSRVRTVGSWLATASTTSTTRARARRSSKPAISKTTALRREDASTSLHFCIA